LEKKQALCANGSPLGKTITQFSTLLRVRGNSERMEGILRRPDKKGGTKVGTSRKREGQNGGLSALPGGGVPWSGRNREKGGYAYRNYLTLGTSVVIKKTDK